MKRRIVCLILCLCLLLPGCGFTGTLNEETVRFYYLCGNYQENLCCVLAEEARDVSGHTGDLPYLMALYLMGPTNDEHRMPLPSGTRIRTQIDSGHIILELSGLPKTMTDAEFSLACACLTLTCLEIMDAEDVTIHSEDRSRTMDRSTLTLYDTTSETTSTEDAA